jgi:hypothetical protein
LRLIVFHTSDPLCHNGCANVRVKPRTVSTSGVLPNGRDTMDLHAVRQRMSPATVTPVGLGTNVQETLSRSKANPDGRPISPRDTVGAAIGALLAARLRIIMVH